MASPPDTAPPALKQVASAESGHLLAARGLADAARPEEAQERVGRALAGRPQLVEAHLLAAVLHARLGDREAALRAYRTADALPGGEEAASVGEGLLLLLDGRLDEAVEALRRAAESQPKAPLPRIALAAALLGLARPEEAAEQATAAAASDRPAGAWLLVAQARLDQGRLDDARHALERSFQHDPRMALARLCLSDVEAAAGRAGRARLAAEHALVIQPVLPTAHWRLARLAAAEGSWDGALQHLDLEETVVPGWTGRPDRPRRLALMRADRGHAMAALGRLDEAVEAYAAWMALERADLPRPWTLRPAPTLVLPPGGPAEVPLEVSPGPPGGRTVLVLDHPAFAAARR